MSKLLCFLIGHKMIIFMPSTVLKINKIDIDGVLPGKEKQVSLRCERCGKNIVEKW